MPGAVGRVVALHAHGRPLRIRRFLALADQVRVILPSLR